MTFLQHHLILFWAKGKINPSQGFIKYNQQAKESGWFWYEWVSNGIVAGKKAQAMPKDFLDLSAFV